MDWGCSFMKECLPSVFKVPASIPSTEINTQKFKDVVVVAHAYDASTREVEAGGSGVQGQPGLYETNKG